MNEKLMHLLMQNFHSKYDNARGDVSGLCKRNPFKRFCNDKIFPFGLSLHIQSITIYYSFLEVEKSYILQLN